MPRRSSKPRDEDANQAAFRVVRELTGDEPEAPRVASQKKNPAAVALGRLGGLKGGKARAAKLSKRRRSEIARDAARQRWQKKAEGGE